MQKQYHHLRCSNELCCRLECSLSDHKKITTNWIFLRSKLNTIGHKWSQTLCDDTGVELSPVQNRENRHIRFPGNGMMVMMVMMVMAKIKGDASISARN